MSVRGGVMTVKAETRFAFPRVGVAVIVMRKGLVLLGERRGAYAAGEWAFPGGKLELNEAWIDCARREVLEETGLHVVIDPDPVGMSNDIWREQRHYVTIYMVARSNKSEAKVMEPDKSATWGWFHPLTMPKPLYLPVRNFLKKDPCLTKTIRRANALLAN